jgi:hypothetical protein
MGVKKKKPLGASRNAYRWKKTEEKLIQAGYINSLDDKEWCVWVDCVSSGTDIIYNLAKLVSASRQGHVLPDGNFSEQVFEVIWREDMSRQVYKCNTIEHAIEVSRYQGKQRR